MFAELSMTQKHLSLKAQPFSSLLQWHSFSPSFIPYCVKTLKNVSAWRHPRWFRLSTDWVGAGSAVKWDTQERQISRSSATVGYLARGCLDEYFFHWWHSEIRQKAWLLLPGGVEPVTFQTRVWILYAQRSLLSGPLLPLNWRRHSSYASTRFRRPLPCNTARYGLERSVEEQTKRR